jgi:hypothetical protein
MKIRRWSEAQPRKISQSSQYSQAGQSSQPANRANTSNTANTAKPANRAFGIPPKNRYDSHPVNAKLTAPPPLALGQEPVPARFHARASAFFSYFQIFPLKN